MFSSSLLTADTPPPSQVKSGGVKASPDLLAEESAASPDGEGSFAKEFQSAAGEEQKVKANQKLVSESQVESESLASSTEDNVTELTPSDPELSKSAGTDADVAELDGQEMGKPLRHNSESDIDVNTSLAIDKQNGQIAASQKPGAQPELDPATKQQIMDDGEALLNRLSQANKQLAPAQAPAPDGQEGKTLPLEHTDATVAVGAVGTLKAEQKEQLPAEQAAASHVQTQQVASMQASKEGMILPQQPGAVEGEVAVDKAAPQANEGQDKGLTDTELQQKVFQAAAVSQGTSQKQAGVVENTALPEAPVAGISQEELAKVFAVPGGAKASGKPLQVSEAQLSQEQVAGNSAELQAGQVPGVNVDQSNSKKASDKQSSAKEISANESRNNESDEADSSMMAAAFALGAAAPPAGSEVKNVQQVAQQPADLLQSANPRTAEMMKEQLVSPDLADGKSKASSVFMPSAAAAATATALATATNGNSQPPLSEASLSPALNSANLTSAPASVTSSMVPDAGTVEAQLSGAAGIAAGTSAMAMGLEHGVTDGNGEVKSAEMTHSLTGLTTQQGLATAQARAEATQAQSPLQLSKEQAGDQLAERVQVMMSKNLKHVDIRLDPPELGKLQIKLSLNQDQASVQFTVGNQQTRDLVEQAMPRLRELLNQQGLQLAQSSVQQDSPRQQFAGQPNQQQNQNNAGQQGNSGGQQNSSGSQHQQAERGGAEPVDMYVSQPSDRVDYYA